MNRLTSDQLILLNGKITNGNDKKQPANEENDQLRARLRDIADAPYAKNEQLFYVYKGVIEKAAKLGCEIAGRRPFKEYNKETAVLALLTLLEINEYKLANYDRDIDELCSHLEDQDIEAGCEWIRRHKPGV